MDGIDLSEMRIYETDDRYQCADREKSHRTSKRLKKLEK
jgi:hypothetical protein